MNAAAWEAARTGAMVVRRTDRRLLRVYGRDPVRMVHGLVSNDVQSLEPGHSVYATLLTPKGRMVADLRVIRRSDDLLLEADAAAAASLADAFRRSVPPLFARAEDVGGQLAVVGIYGPEATRLVSAALGCYLPDVPLDDAATATFLGADVIALRTDHAGVEGWDCVVASDHAGALHDALGSAGAVSGDLDTVEALRIEGGRPRWGAELTPDVIPLEAGLKDRAISTSKGCYTGQEVIIRILHRGHVNRHLRGLRFENGVPEVGDELFHADIRPGKPVGAVTSAVRSPRSGEIFALAWVRREVEPGDTVHVGGAGGPSARVVELPFRSD